MSVKYTLRGYLWCFWCPCYALVLCQTDEINTIFNPSSVIQMRAQVNCNTFIDICWLIQTFTYQCCGFEVHFKSILVYDLKTKRDFWPTCPPYIMGFMINLDSLFFPFSLVLNLAYIDYSLCQIWSVCMQYLRCFDHSNKCLFPVIQQAEMLLNFFGGCTPRCLSRISYGTAIGPSHNSHNASDM